MAKGPWRQKAHKGKVPQRVNYLEGQSAQKDTVPHREKSPESPNGQKRIYSDRQIEVREREQEQEY